MSTISLLALQVSQFNRLLSVSKYLINTGNPIRDEGR